MVKTYCGIDPGNKGAIAFVNDKGDACCIPMPVIKIKTKESIDGFAVKELLLDGKPLVVGLELVNAMPGQGVTSMFNFGKGSGLLEGILIGVSLPFELIRPQAWKKTMLSGTAKDKGAAIMKAKQLFPEVSLKRTERSRTDSDGMAEALLIAEYTRRLTNS